MQAVEMLSVSLCVLHVPSGACFWGEGLFYVNGKKVILAGSLALLVSMTLLGCGSGVVYAWVE